MVEELKPSGRGIVVDKSNAKETYPLRGTSIMDTLSFGKTTQQITNVKDKTNEQLLILEE